MSGDVQPRRRKDKKRKRDDRKSEGEINLSRQHSLQEDDETSHGVQNSHMGSDDQHIHVYQEPHTGGHWFAKILFFILMAIIFGLVGMIILETRGLSDLDTPLSESRYSDYLHGWVEEHREEHDDHDEVAASIEEHEEHDEPFEEEEDHSEVDEENHAEDDHEDDEGDDQNDGDGDDEDNEVDVVSEEVPETNEVDDDVEDDDNGDASNNNENIASDDDDDENDDNVDNNENDLVNDEATNESAENINITVEDDNDNDDDDDNDDVDSIEKDNESIESRNQASANHHSKDDDDFLDSFDEDDDDPSETVFLDNDAEELLLLQEKERRWAEENKKETPDDDNEEKLDKEADVITSYLSRLAVNIGVGVALALVARVVLMRKSPNTKNDSEKREAEESTPSNEILMQRRVTIASAEEAFPEDDHEDEIIFDEELEMEEEEVEYVEEEEEEIEIDIDDDAEEIKPTPRTKYVPGTFEEYQAMYRPTNYTSPEPSSTVEEIRGEEQKGKRFQEATASPKKPPAVFTAPPPPPLDNVESRKSSLTMEKTTELNKSASSPASVSASSPTSASYLIPSPAPSSSSAIEPASIPSKVSFSEVKPSETTVLKSLPPLLTEPTTREVTHDLDYHRDEDDIDDYDTEDDYDGDEEVVDEEEDGEEGDEEIEALDDVDDGSDVDDSELMNRLEAKYGRLPAKEYESDEDPDDPTWTQINEKLNTKPGGGPLSQDDEDYSYLIRDRYRRPQDIHEDIVYEDEMARANDELLRQHHGRALVAYSELSRKFQDRPQPFLGQARIYDYLAEKHSHAQFLVKSIEAYKRYLAFDELIENDAEYRDAAERCIHRMRSLGHLKPALTIHRMLVDRLPNDPEPINQLVLTLLMMDRYSEAKSWLSILMKKWPQNGLSLVLLGYVLKMDDCEYIRAAQYLRRGIESRAKGTQEARFYIALGEVYERLGHFEHASATYKRGADLKLFPSLNQRSVFNQPNLRAQPVWRLEEKKTSYAYDLRAISAHWQIIRDEGLNLLNSNGDSVFLDDGFDYFRPEAENLLAAGNWKELVLFSRGERHERNCQRAPTTCWLIQQFKAASTCRRGQVKFSVMQPGTHVWPHCGPTNSRLRAHLGLVVPPRTRMRVVNETLNWIEGEFIVFDDSFEHEVWHEGEKLRMILIVDFWHPDLNEEQIQGLSKV